MGPIRTYVTKPTRGRPSRSKWQRIAQYRLQHHFWGLFRIDGAEILSAAVFIVELSAETLERHSGGGMGLNTSFWLNRVPLRMDFTEINSSGKRGELLGRIDRQNSRFRTAKTIIIKFGLHASFVELESAKNAVNAVLMIKCPFLLC
ncbi:uncharacterized protein TNCV_3807621 [Trichonephila clavipes]|nr:uncharacterized protein TNCV_3807621 [Trichonephila clavipes]